MVKRFEYLGLPRPHLESLYEPLDLSQLGDDLFGVHFLTVINFSLVPSFR